MSSSLLLALLVNRSPTERLIQNILNNPFAGIHQLAWFDWAMLIPYFTVLVIFRSTACTATTSSALISSIGRRGPLEPAKRFEQLPPVTIQLPLYNERYVVERLIEETVKMEYPQGTAADPGAGRFHRRYARPLPKRWWSATANLGYPIEYHHRTNRHGFKAGALQEGLKTATGELVAVFDADFIPPADFLTRTIHYFADPTVGVVQTRWSYLNRDYNFLTEVEAHAARRPLHSGAWRPVAGGILLQLQRHGRHSAQTR